MRTILSLLLFLAFTQLSAQTDNIYNPEADAMKQIDEAVSQAKQSNKHVLLLVGGNWCPWCRKFHAYINENPQIDSLIKADYIKTYINYSKENKNTKALERLEYPQRFGFPVFVILDENGKRIHTQNSALLESGKGYDRDKVIGFLMNWRPQALQPENYRD